MFVLLGKMSALCLRVILLTSLLVYNRFYNLKHYKIILKIKVFQTFLFAKNFFLPFPNRSTVRRKKWLREKKNYQQVIFSLFRFSFLLFSRTRKTEENLWSPRVSLSSLLFVLIFSLAAFKTLDTILFFSKKINVFLCCEK